jgi:hypothetical protein
MTHHIIDKMADPLLSTAEIHREEPNIKPGFLEKKRCSGDGPPYIKIGRKVLYRRSEFRQWLERHRRTSTSDSCPAKGMLTPAEVSS